MIPVSTSRKGQGKRVSHSCTGGTSDGPPRREAPPVPRRTGHRVAVAVDGRTTAIESAISLPLEASPVTVAKSPGCSSVDRIGEAWKPPGQPPATAVVAVRESS
jgi:hypothetical protein